MATASSKRPSRIASAAARVGAPACMPDVVEKNHDRIRISTTGVIEAIVTYNPSLVRATPMCASSGRRSFLGQCCPRRAGAKSCLELEHEISDRADVSYPSTEPAASSDGL